MTISCPKPSKTIPSLRWWRFLTSFHAISFSIREKSKGSFNSIPEGVRKRPLFFERINLVKETWKRKKKASVGREKRKPRKKSEGFREKEFQVKRPK